MSFKGSLCEALDSLGEPGGAPMAETRGLRHPKLVTKVPLGWFVAGNQKENGSLFLGSRCFSDTMCQENIVLIRGARRDGDLLECSVGINAYVNQRIVGKLEERLDVGTESGAFEA